MDYTVHGILQTRIAEWIVFSFSRGSSQPREQTQASRIAGGFFTTEPQQEFITNRFLVVKSCMTQFKYLFLVTFLNRIKDTLVSVDNNAPVKIINSQLHAHTLRGWWLNIHKATH